MLLFTAILYGNLVAAGGGKRNPFVLRSPGHRIIHCVPHARPLILDSFQIATCSIKNKTKDQIQQQCAMEAIRILKALYY